MEKPTFRTEVIHDPDWGEAWKKYFKPLRVSRNIVIKPTWERFAPTGRDIVIEIDPGMAFGTGQHASTRMCLDAIEEILLRDRTFEKWHVLDVGTGTGILGIACAKLDAERVLCVDIDQKATEIARENVLINQVEDRVEIANRDVATVSESFRADRGKPDGEDPDQAAPRAPPPASAPAATSSSRGSSNRTDRTSRPVSSAIPLRSTASSPKRSGSATS